MLQFHFVTIFMSISAGRYVVVDVSSEDFLKNAIFRFWQKSSPYLLTCCELTLHLLVEGETSHPEIHKVRKVLSVSMRKEAVVRSDLTYRFDI